jgi:hypothetical protein
VKFAEQSPELPVERVYDYVYANSVAAGVSSAKSGGPAADTAATIG